MNPARAYSDTQKHTASRERLMIMLFEGALAQMRRGAVDLQAGRRRDADKAISRAAGIVVLLRSTLDPTRAPELCQKLGDVYTFVEARLVSALASGGVAALRDAEAVFAPLVLAFRKAVAAVDGPLTPETT